MLWFTQGMCFLPAFLVVWSSTTFVVAYIVALFRKDVDVVFPYISDTGANPPESCIFGFMTSIASFTGVLTMYARYKFVERLGRENRVLRPSLNVAALVLGLLSCLGMCFVATFQETTVMPVHDAGALLFFISGVLYIILQSVISYQIYPHSSSLVTCGIRTAIATVALLAIFPTIICAFFVTRRTTLHRDARDKDYSVYLASAVSEWIVAFSFVCFFFTYIPEFKLFALQVKVEWLEYF